MQGGAPDGDGSLCFLSFSTNQPTACRARKVTAPVRVTHPFYPLFGQEIAFVERRVHWGDDLLFYRDHRGYVTSLPTRWTSLQDEEPFLVVSDGRSHFRVTDLIDLVSLIAEIQSALRTLGGRNKL